MNRYKDLIQQAEQAANKQGPTRAEQLLGASRIPAAKARPVTTNDLGMNKTEALYASHLDIQRRDGVILNWWWDAITLKLGHDCRYRTDFLVQLPDGEMQLHETKGHMEDDALVKLKTCRASFPFRLFLVRKAKQGAWNITEIKSW